MKGIKWNSLIHFFLSSPYLLSPYFSLIFLYFSLFLSLSPEAKFSCCHHFAHTVPALWRTPTTGLQIDSYSFSRVSLCILCSRKSFLNFQTWRQCLFYVPIPTPRSTCPFTVIHCFQVPSEFVLLRGRGSVVFILQLKQYLGPSYRISLLNEWNRHWVFWILFPNLEATLTVPHMKWFVICRDKFESGARGGWCAGPSQSPCEKFSQLLNIISEWLLFFPSWKLPKFYRKILDD